MTDKLLPINQALNHQNQDTDEIDLRELFGTILESKWLIIFVTTISLLFGILYAVLSTPIYNANAMLQIEESSQPLGGLEAMEGIFGGKVPVDTEIEIIKSRMVLNATVDALKLDISVEPEYFPVFGKAIARNFKTRNKDKVSAPLFGRIEYAWGGELVKVETFEVPRSWEDKDFTLISGVNGYFKIFDEEQQLLIDGQVGKQITVPLEGEETLFTIFVSQLKSRPDTHFILKKQSKIEAMDNLLDILVAAEKGEGTGILGLSLESTSPLLAKETLNQIANIYVQQNVEKKSTEAQNTLEFLEKQLPTIKNQLELATAALNEYRLQKGSVDLEIETQSILVGVVEKGTQITLLQQKRDELRRNFTSSHPSVIAIDKQINRLDSQMKKHNKKITELPETQQVILRLSRDVQVNTELYTTLLNHLQTIKVAKAGTVGDVRVVDHAILPNIPVKPKKALIIALALVSGLILGILLAFIRKALNRGLEDPDEIEKYFNIPVYATVPHSSEQKTASKGFKNNKKRLSSLNVLALSNTDDLAIESLRSLRTTLHFAFLEAKNNIIMITGPSPGIGKSFISVNLAVVLANSGKKVLLIDGDMRKGQLNKQLNVDRENGLSDLISSSITISDAIQKIESTKFDFISTGEIPPNPSELLLQARFEILLETLSREYDQIIIDSPPILAVTDASIMGRLASATLMVLKAGEHPIKEIDQSIKRFKQNNIEIKGVIFNDIPLSSSLYGYGYAYPYSY